MPITTGQIRKLRFLLLLALVVAVATGAVTGIFLAKTRSIQNTLNIGEYTPALPSLILDRRGRMISQFFAEEKRQIIGLEELPQHLVYALVAKEDRNFYSHIGFSVKGFLRAAWNIATGNYFSGGSTISQQVAGNLYEDREVETLGRKLKELFWSIQLEISRTKDEILEVYLNYSSFGHGTYGVEAASQFYFGHSVREVSLAEAAILVAQLAPVNSMIRNPNRAQIVQRATLDAMVEMSFVSQKDADESFDEFWRTYDTTRSNLATAYTERYDEAPYFSDLVRRQFETTFYGSPDLYRDGFTIHTTLDLGYQRTAEALLEETRLHLNAQYRDAQNRAVSFAESNLLPMLELLSLHYSMNDLGLSQEIREGDALLIFDDLIAAPLNALSLTFGSYGIQGLMGKLRSLQEEDRREVEVEGALVTIDNEKGYILALVGGSDFSTLQFNLATDAFVSPGSSIKPLYYARAIENEVISPATLLYDSPAVFYSDLNPPYSPRNFLGSWEGPVLVRKALSRSMNVPSIKVLERIGLEEAIGSVTLLLGEEENAADRLLFPRAYPIGLGTVGVSPLQMARAYATFPRGGQGVEPFAIRYIEDRYGNLFYDYEREVLKETSREKMLLSPQAAYIMTNLLSSTVTEGTLARRAAEVGGFGDMPMAGKTGTTENWSDAWTVGFSPFVTTAVWYGFVLPGRSLGRYQTGALSAGPVWAAYMKRIHEDLPAREFARPNTGIIERQVCSVSGLLPTEQCTDGHIREVFTTGTAPKELCDYHKSKAERDTRLMRRMLEKIRTIDVGPLLSDLALPSAGEKQANASEENGNNEASAENPLLQQEEPFQGGPEAEKKAPE